jgi:hypothetical protein
MQLQEGQWLTIEVPNNSYPVHIAIDGGEAEPAWIDRIPEYVGKVRVGSLRRGRHTATAITEGQSYTVEFEVY